MAYTPGQGASGASTTATPGSSSNKPAAGKQKYGVDVVVGTPSAADAEYNRKHGHEAPPPTTTDLGNVLQSLYGMSNTQIKHLQDRLVSAGLLSRKAITYGVADEDTAAAYEKILLRNGYAHQAGKDQTVDQTIDEAIGANPPSLDGSSERPPFHAQLTSPEEIRAELEADAPSIIGRKLTDAEMTKLIESFRAAELKSKRAYYDTEVSGGVVSDSPPLSTFALQQIRAIDPVGAGVVDREKAADTFFNVLSQSSGKLQQY